MHCKHCRILSPMTNDPMGDFENGLLIIHQLEVKLIVIFSPIKYHIYKVQYDFQDKVLSIAPTFKLENLALIV